VGGGPADAGTIVGLLADPDRLRVFAAVVLGAGTSSAVIEATGLAPRTAIRALERLVGAGVVVPSPDGFLADAALFGSAARAAAAGRSTGTSAEDMGATPEQAEVLRHFVAEGRISRIPASRSKRLVLLDFLAGHFEPGRSYPEPEVNRILATFHADHAALRRYLVDEGFMERRDAFYWRSGGTFDTDDA
jgi:hypothetical protein